MRSIHIRRREAWLAVLVVLAASLPAVAQTAGSARERSVSRGTAFGLKGTKIIKTDQAWLPPFGVDIWFSTETSFTVGSPDGRPDAVTQVGGGDLLSWTGQVVRYNGELAGRLGIMPPVPPLGLDAVMLAPGGAIWFSFKETTAPIWSETLSTWLQHGDLLSESGAIVRTNEQLLAKFERMPPVTEAGLDAITRAPNGSFLFSTTTDFFSQRLGEVVRRGDLLSDRGVIALRNQDLLRNFQIHNPAMKSAAVDYGLDAVILRSNTEIWFSTEVGFQDARLGPISDGDLLSTAGYVVARNFDLVAAFAPVEDVDSFGLDAMAVGLPVMIGDLDLDGDVDQADLRIFRANLTMSPGPDGAISAVDPLNFADMDGDGLVNLNDFGIFQRSVNRPDVPVANGAK